jgi:tRNA A-37 threonylcarbamoyl transferase component Bud32
MNLPRKFGRFTLTELIAKGGMAEIYRAHLKGERGFVKEVALKKILPTFSNDKAFVDMLCDEARALVNLQHQNIVQVFELDRHKESFYISMELVDGIDLSKLLCRVLRSGKKIPVKFSCFIMAEILKALGFAHRRWIIHRDVSPQNVLISWSGEVKVADFGIAKGSHRTFETATGGVKGKYAYMSPEQASACDIDHRSDIYSAGVVFYELLTGRPPRVGGNEGIPDGLQKIVMRALRPGPSERYQSAEEYFNELNEYVIDNHLVTHGLELAMYLKEVFEEDVGKGAALPGSLRENNFQGTLKNFRHSGASRNQVNLKALNLAAVLLFILAAIGCILWWKYSSAPAVANAPKAIQTVVIEPPRISPLPEGETASTQNPLPPRGRARERGSSIADTPATVNIHARPWAYAYLDGYIERKETPIAGTRVKAGSYTLRLNYAPTDAWLVYKLKVTAGEVINCLGDFEKQNKITCKVKQKKPH